MFLRPSLRLPGPSFLKGAPRLTLGVRAFTLVFLNPGTATRIALKPVKSDLFGRSITATEINSKRWKLLAPLQQHRACLLEVRLYSTDSKSSQKEELAQEESTTVTLTEEDSVKSHLELLRKIEEKAKQDEKDPRTPFRKSVKTIGRIIKLGRPDLRLFLYAMGFICCAVLFPTVIVKFTGAGIDALNDRDRESGEIMIWGYDIWTLSYMMVPFAVFSSACFWARLYLLKLLGERLAARFRQKVMKKLLRHDAAFYDGEKHKAGDLISRLSSDAYIVSRSITSNLPDGLKNTLFGVVSSYMMYSISPTLFGVIAILSPLLISGSIYFGRQLEGLSIKLQDAVAGLTKVTEETLNSIKLVKAFGSEDKQLHKYSNELRSVIGVAKAEAMANSNYLLSIYSLFSSAYTVSLFLGFHLILGDKLTTGELVSFTIYADYFNMALYALTSVYVDLMKGVGAAAKLFNLIDYKEQVSPVKGCKAPPTLANDVEFKDVVFNYPSRPSDLVFNNCSFKIKGGSSTCFVAPSGAGKSTVASLLLRSYNLNEGLIYIGGRNIEEFQVRELRRNIIGIVQQEPVLLSGTILENIVYGLTEEEVAKVTLADVINVAKQANCHDFIDAFPDKYKTVIGTGGASLSGGQKQRVAIARALIKKPAVLILDEATSALDLKLEALINDTLKNLNKSGGMTIISIAHRLSTISKSENVIVLDKNGKVAEEGKFITLINDPDSELSKLLDEQTYQGQEERLSEDELQEQERRDRKAEDLEEAEARKLKLEKIREILQDMPLEVRAEIFQQFTKEVEDENIEAATKSSIEHK